MGRRSKLTEKQWMEISQRALNGEPMRALAREFGIAESSLREKISAQNAQIKALANQKVTLESKIKALPVTAQVQVFNLADELAAIQTNIVGAGRYGSVIAKHSLKIAAKQMATVDPDDPMESADTLQAISGLTRIANDASTIGMTLTRYNQGQPATKEITIARSYGRTA